MKNNLVHQLSMLCQITRQIETNESSHKNLSGRSMINMGQKSQDEHYMIRQEKKWVTLLVKPTKLEMITQLALQNILAYKD